jgi:hypothetical protein
MFIFIFVFAIEQFLKNQASMYQTSTVFFRLDYFETGSKFSNNAISSKINRIYDKK